MEALVVEQEDVRLCKVDIDAWSSDVSRQFRLQRIPRLLLYDGSKLVAEGTEPVMRHLMAR